MFRKILGLMSFTEARKLIFVMCGKAYMLLSEDAFSFVLYHSMLFSSSQIIYSLKAAIIVRKELV